MPENEELRLTVTLVDNASQGLRQLQGQMAELGQGQGADNMRRMTRNVQEMHERGIKPWLENIDKAGRAILPEFARGVQGSMTAMIGFGAGAVGAGVAIAEVIRTVGAAREKFNAFLADTQKLSDLQTITGQHAAEIKKMGEAYREAGHTVQEGREDFIAMSHAMADTTRTFSKVRQEMLSGIQTPEQTRAMIQAIEEIKRTGTVTDAMNKLREYGAIAEDNIRKRLRAQREAGQIVITDAEIEQRAAEAAEKLYRFYNLKGLQFLKKPIIGPTPEEIAQQDQYIAQVQKLNELYGQIEGHWDKIESKAISTLISWTNLIPILERWERILGLWTEGRLVPKDQPVEQAPPRWNYPPGVKRPPPNAPLGQQQGTTPGARPQYFSGTGEFGPGWDDMRMSQNVEISASRVVNDNLLKATRDLANEMKRLNDNLQLGAFGPGGAAGLPGGLGLFGGGGGAGGGIGPYAGAGLGRGGLYFPQGGGGGAQLGPGGGSVGTGGINDAASFDKAFKGTALEGHWSDVETAAKANNVPPNLMAAIMAHETGLGRVLTGNNVAGIMGGPGGSKSQYPSIGAGILDAGRIIGKNYERAGGDIDKLARIYAPPGAANDPRGLNAGWAAGVRHYLGGGADGGSTRPSGAAGDPAVPGDILARARQVALVGGPGAVDHFMREQGYPKAGNWCGEFAASVVKSVGGTPPPGAAVASNWRRWGVADPTPHVGDIAVANRNVPTGATGSHVTFVESYDPKTGTFIGLGGNQRAGFESRFRASEYSFRRPDVDRALSHRVEGTGHIDVNVNGPKGTVVRGRAGGLFKHVSISRQTQMEPTATSSYEE